MVWIALGLLGLTTTVVVLVTMAGGWGMGYWRFRWILPSRMDMALVSSGGSGAHVMAPNSLTVSPPRVLVRRYDEIVKDLESMPPVERWAAVAIPAAGVQDAVAAASRVALERSRFFVFSNWVVFSLFVGFLLPIWSLSFATEALGGEREGRTLVWLLTRPLPRPAVYLATFAALLPWSLGLNLGGFGLLCLLAGPPGHLAFRLYWPAILGGTLAFAALFHLMGACFRRAAIVALVYAFFLETVLGSMPGYMKRVSIAFYTRCLMFDAARDYSVQLEKPSIYLPVDAATAWGVLAAVTVLLLLGGMVVFARAEYADWT